MNRHRDSPRVRRLAHEAGLDLADIVRTGRHGRATVDDVARAARRAVAGVSSSLDHTALRTAVVEVDLTRISMMPGVPDSDLHFGGGTSAVLGFVAEADAHVRSVARFAERMPDITVTDVGHSGLLFDVPLMSQSGAATLGVGALVRRPVVVSDDTGEERLAIRAMSYLALTYDHLLVESAAAARYLETVKQRLEERTKVSSDSVLSSGRGYVNEKSVKQ